MAQKTKPRFLSGLKSVIVMVTYYVLSLENICSHQIKEKLQTFPHRVRSLEEASFCPADVTKIKYLYSKSTNYFKVVIRATGSNKYYIIVTLKI